jgi:hypothetical protein
MRRLLPGSWLLHIDSDEWLHSCSVSDMLKKALAAGANTLVLDNVEAVVDLESPDDIDANDAFSPALHYRDPISSYTNGKSIGHCIRGNAPDGPHRFKMAPHMLVDRKTALVLHVECVTLPRWRAKFDTPASMHVTFPSPYSVESTRDVLTGQTRAFLKWRTVAGHKTHWPHTPLFTLAEL